MPDDLLHFTQIIGHDGRTAQSQRHVGTIIDCDIIGNKMHQRPFLPYGAQYIFKWVHPSAFLSPSAGCSSSTRPSHMGPFSPDLGNRLPDTGPYSGNPPTHQSLSSAFLPGGKTLPSDARHPMIWPSCLCHSLPPTQPRRPGLCLSAIHVARTIPAILLGRFAVGNPLHFAETPLPALREDRLFLPLIFRFTKEYFHKPLFLRNRIDTRPMLD